MDYPELSEIVLADDIWRHIIYGDNRGGGHKYGILPRPAERKTWFPVHWGSSIIQEAVMAILAEPTVVRQTATGFSYFGEYKGVRIKALVDIRMRLVTAHPLDGAGVIQVKVYADPNKSPKYQSLLYGKNKEVSW